MPLQIGVINFYLDTPLFILAEKQTAISTRSLLNNLTLLHEVLRANENSEHSKAFSKLNLTFFHNIILSSKTSYLFQQTLFL